MTIEIQQASKPTSTRHWKWQVWLEGPPKELDEVDRVEYELHSTFRDPVRTVKDRETNFKLSSSAWGEFNIHATVHLKDGQSRKLAHWLRLGVQAPVKGAQPFEFPTKGQSPVVFLSAGSGDSAFASKMKRALSGRGVHVMSQEDVPTASGIESELQSMIERADFGIVVVSEDTSPWVEKDVELMRSRSIPVILLMLDVDQPPEQMRDLKGLRTYQNDDLDERAGKIVELAEALVGG